MVAFVLSYLLLNNALSFINSSNAVQNTSQNLSPLLFPQMQKLLGDLSPLFDVLTTNKTVAGGDETEGYLRGSVWEGSSGGFLMVH